MKKYRVMRTRNFAPVPTIWNGISQTSPHLKEIHGVKPKNVWMRINEAGEYSGIYSEQEWEKVSNYLGKKLENIDFARDLYEKQKKAGEKGVKLAEKIISSSLEGKGLLSLAQEIKNAWLELDGINVPPWFIAGDDFEKKTRTLLEDQGIEAEDIITLMTPSKPSFSMEEEMFIIDILVEHPDVDFDNIPEEVEKKIADLVDRYYWVPFGYDGPETYDKEHYIKVLKEYSGKSNLKERLREIKTYEKRMRKKKERIIKKHSISKDTADRIKALEILVAMTDERKECHFRLHIAFHKVLEKFARNIGITREEAKICTLNELEKHSAEELRKIAKERSGSTVYFHSKDGVLEIKDKKHFEEIESYLQSQKNNIVKGVIACKGDDENVKGVARILNSSSEIERVTEEDILVTQMTTPEFVPAMRKCRAIVTDEGGVTCHAAIVSRELNKLCIIGTGNATKSLEDGEMIEINFEKGVVRKID